MSTRGVLALCILLALLGWFTLGSFTYHNPPNALNRWIALTILWPTLLVTFLPPAYAIHVHLRSSGDIVPRATRQSALAALFLTLCVLLRMMQTINWANTTLMLVLFVLTEVLLSAREDRQ